ncbi:hypothetical protein [Shewanella indica]|uniref:hypothetical protein n=1 Tax=Shewanella indica TaxID=768528 RepID=UPI00399AD89C
MKSNSLFHYAFVHEEFCKTGDIFKGIIPLFSPIIEKRDGQQFEPTTFSKYVKEFYGLDIHPYVAEEFGSKLLESGHLIKDSQGLMYYNYKNIKISKNTDLKENIAKLFSAFELFASKLIKKNVKNIDFPSEFSHRLARINDIGSIQEVAQDGEDIKSILDYAFARFVYRITKVSSSLSEVLMDAYSGAVFSEVVLNLQNPKFEQDKISGKIVYIDANIILDILGFNDEYSVDCSRKLIEELNRIGCIVSTTDYYIDEVKETVSASYTNYRNKGPRKTNVDKFLFKNPTKIAFVSSLITNTEQSILNYGFNLNRIYKSAHESMTSQKSQSVEGKIYFRLGEYRNDTARTRDAKTISFILCNNGLKDYKSIYDYKSVFLTKNKKMLRATNDYLVQESIVTLPYFSPIIDDRSMAKLLWIMTGGKTDDLSRETLISNCRKVVEDHRDLFEKVKVFLKNIPENQAQIYESIINNDRAIFSLMDVTSGNPDNINEQNIHEVFDRAISEIEDEAIQQERIKSSNMIDKIESKNRREYLKKEQEIEKKENEIHSKKSEIENLKLELNKMININECLEKKSSEQEDKIRHVEKSLLEIKESKQVEIENYNKTQISKQNKASNLLKLLITIAVILIILNPHSITEKSFFENDFFSLEIKPTFINTITILLTISLTWIWPKYVYDPIISRVVTKLFPIKKMDKKP